MKMGKINEYWNQFWKWTDRQWMVIKKWKYWEAFLVVFLVIILILTILYFNTISSYLFSSEDRNGELAKVILTMLGGIGVIYGLVLNSKRIKEQTKQNFISENSNFDKRFSDAVGYLGSDNTPTVLGGIYALYQLAKEDKRYKTIVGNLLCSYIREKSDLLYKDLPDYPVEVDKKLLKVPVIIETIVNLLNNEENVFKNETLDLTGATLRHIRFKNDTENYIFNKSNMFNCRFHKNMYKCRFMYATLEKCIFEAQIDQADFFTSGINNCEFRSKSIKNTIFDGSVIHDTMIAANFTFSVNYFNTILNNVQFYIDRMDHSWFRILLGSRCIYFQNTIFSNVKIETTSEIIPVFNDQCKNIPNIEKVDY